MKYVQRLAIVAVGIVGMFIPSTVFGAGLLCVDDSGHSAFLSHASADGGQFKTVVDPKLSGNLVTLPGSKVWPSTAAPIPAAAASGNSGLFGLVYEAPHYLSAAVPSAQASALPVASVATSYIHLTGGTLTQEGHSSGGTQGSDGTPDSSSGNTSPPPPPPPAPSTLLNGLVSYWKLDEASGDAADSVGSATLTNVGGATYAAGVVGNGATLTGAAPAGQYLSIDGAAPHSPNITGDMTLGCWVKMNSQPADTYPIIAKWGTTSEGTSYRLAYQETPGIGHQLNFATNGSINENIVATQTLTNGIWHYVAATAEGTNGTIYVNGVGIGSGRVAAIKNSNTTPFQLGHQAGYDMSGDQEQDECALWSRALTPSEISDLYNAGHGKQHPFESGTIVAPT